MLSRTSITPSSLGSITAPFTQATATAQPWIASVGGKQYLRCALDDVVSTSSAATWKFLHDGSGCTIFHVNRPVVIASSVLSWTAINPSSIGTFLSFSGGYFRINIGNGTGAWAFDRSYGFASAVGSTNIYCVSITSNENGINWRYNGVNRDTGTSSVLSASAPTASAKSTLLITTKSEVWKINGCFSTVSSPSVTLTTTILM